MPLDVTASRQTTTAELHYLKRTAEKPARHVMRPPPGVPQWNGVDDPGMAAGTVSHLTQSASTGAPRRHASSEG
jgi:hypothetical protein